MSDNKEPYFNLGKAFSELRHETVGAKEVAVSSLKLLGKGVFNVAKFAAIEVAPAIAESAMKHTQRTSEELLKRDDLSAEQRDRAQEGLSKSSEYLQKRSEARQQRREEDEENELANAEAARENKRVRAREEQAQQLIPKPESAEPRASDAQVTEAASIAPARPSIFSRAAAMGGKGSSDPC